MIHEHGDPMKPVSVASSGRARPERVVAASARPRGTREASAAEEPRTGVVAKVNGGAASSGASSRASGPSGRGLAPPQTTRATASPSGAPEAGAWRCLEWAPRPSRAPAQVAPEITVAQLSGAGILQRHSGPNGALPQTTLALDRMAAQIARGLGFSGCRALCLRGPSSVLSMTRAAAQKVVSAAGPLGPMQRVLARFGLA